MCGLDVAVDSPKCVQIVVVVMITTLCGIMHVIWLGVFLVLCFAMMYWFLEVAS